MKAFPRDVEVQTMTTRHIGVESELGVPSLVTPQLQRQLMKRGLLQSIGYDGGGREFRTHPISIRSLKQVRGHKYLTEYYETLKGHTRVQESGGTHIHISILSSDHPNMEANATAMGIAFFRQFQKIAGRETHWAWQRDHRTLEEVQAEIDRNVQGDRTYSMKGSMLNPTWHRTLEFRGPKGCNNSEEILAWVEFLDNVVKLANRKSVEGITFKRLLRGKRISAYVEALEDWRKLTDEELEQKFNGSQLINRRSW